MRGALWKVEWGYGGERNCLGSRVRRQIVRNVVLEEADVTVNQSISLSLARARFYSQAIVIVTLSGIVLISLM